MHWFLRTYSNNQIENELYNVQNFITFHFGCIFVIRISIFIVIIIYLIHNGLLFSYLSFLWIFVWPPYPMWAGKKWCQNVVWQTSQCSFGPFGSIWPKFWNLADLLPMSTTVWFCFHYFFFLLYSIITNSPVRLFVWLIY